MNNQALETYIKTREQLSREEHQEIDNLIKIITKHEGGPVSRLECSDGRKYEVSDQYHAFNHQRLIWIRQMLVQRYHEKKVDAKYWMLLSQSAQSTGAFKACYHVVVPEPTYMCAEEICFMHPMLNIHGVMQYLKNHGAGGYLISYGEIDKYGLHKLEAEEVIFTPVKLIQSRLAQLQIELEDL